MERTFFLFYQNGRVEMLEEKTEARNVGVQGLAVSQMSQMIGVTLSLSVPVASYKSTCWDELVLKNSSCR